MTTKPDSIIKKSLVLIKNHVFTALFCFILSAVFSMLIAFKLGGIIYSVGVIATVITYTYTIAWNMADKDLKKVKAFNKNPENAGTEIKVKPSDGFISALPLTIISLLACGGYVFFKDAGGALGVAGNFAFTLWNSPYIVVIAKTNVSPLLISLIPQLLISVGYFAGTKQKYQIDDIFYRLIYKKKKETDKPQ